MKRITRKEFMGGMAATVALGWRSISTDRRLLPKAVARVVALCGMVRFAVFGIVIQWWNIWG
jgi:hypothetical protein